MRRSVLVLCALLSVSGLQAQPRLPTVDPVYSVEVTSGVIYGQGRVELPFPGDADLLLDLYQPVDAATSGQRSPAVVIIHGGAFLTGSRTKEELVEMAHAMASRGHVAVSIDYRLIPDRPVPSDRVASILEAALDGAGGATSTSIEGVVAAIDDALTAVDWLRTNADALNIDPDQIGLIGGSAGAITAVHLGYVLDDYGVDVNPFAYVVDLWGGSLIPANNPLTAANHLQTGEPPLFIVHGTEDVIVPFALSVLLADRALEQNVVLDYHPIEGAEHSFSSIDLNTVEAHPGVTLMARLLEWTRLIVIGRQTITLNYGMSGSWFNPDTPGQGYLIDVDPVARTLFVAWFVYDTVAGTQTGEIPGSEQRWFTAQGYYLGPRADLVVSQSRGGVFNQSNAVSTEAVGTLTIEFQDCNTAVLNFDLDAFALSGSVPIIRLLPDVVCQRIADGELQIPEPSPEAAQEH